MKEFLNVLVTGGAGFIGSHLVNGLIARGYRVVVLDNFRSGRMENISQHLKDESFRLVKEDVRNRRAVRDAMDGVDAVVHLAALSSVGESMDKPFETHEVNATGTLNVLEEAVRGGVKRFVFASSASVYGEGNALPLCEDCPPQPISPYAASKVSAECYCIAFHRSYGLKSVILRYFNVYGPMQEHSPYSGVIVRFLNNALGGKPLLVYGDGGQTRDFIHVGDVIEATILALESDDFVGEAFNVCTGKPTTINELVKIIRDVTGRDLQIIYDRQKEGDVRDSYGDPMKAEKMLGFRAKICLRDGLEQFINSARSNFLLNGLKRPLNVVSLGH